MKQFLKTTLAVIVGVLIASIISTLIFIGIIGAIISSGEGVTVLRPNSVYRLDLRGTLVERASDSSPLDMLTARLMGGGQAIGLDQILANIQKAKTNDNIVGIYLNIGSFSAGQASVTEIRNALLEFRESGKFVVAYADHYSQRMFYLASVADYVILNPVGAVSFRGLASTFVSFRNLLDNIGVEMQIVKVGEFKSASEPFTEIRMSDANREQVTVFVNSTWNNMLNAISVSRGISVEELNRIADNVLDFRGAQQALDYRMVDKLMYQSEVEDFIKTLIGDTGRREPAFVRHSAMNNVPTGERFNRTRIAVIYAVGAIDMSENEGIVSRRLVRTINQVAEDDNIKAVVLRINSPGGSAFGSEQIWHALTELRERKPLIISMGDLAASGGYWIAAAGDKILAQPNTLTGSIGVFGQIPNTAGLARRVGLNFDVVKTNRMSDGVITGYRAFTPEERLLVQYFVNQTYDLFLYRIADCRGMELEQVKALADGRVWTGECALALGLVDEIGGIDRAIVIAAERAEIENFTVVRFPEQEDFMTLLLRSMSGDLESRVLRARLGSHYETFRRISDIRYMNGVFALMPFGLNVY